MKLQKHRSLISLLPVFIIVMAVLFAFFNFAQANGSANEVIGQATLDGLPADGAAVVLTDVNSAAFLTDTVGATGSSSVSGYYYFDLSNLSIAPTNGDVINIDVTINTLVASTSFVFDSSIATVTPAIIAIVTPDVTPPVITLNGSSTVDVLQNTVYTDLGATASDDVDGDITANIIATGTVDTAIVGQYTITYDVSDAANNTATSVIRTVNVIATDITAPVITILDANPMDVFQYTVFTDPGATALDNIDGDLTANIIATGTVDTAILGQYILTYSVTDVASNTASTTRTVNVVPDTIPPVITLTGSSSVNIDYGGTYTESGAIWTDNADGTGSAIVGGQTVNTSVAGTYIITYNYTDSSSNAATQVTRSVVVGSRSSSGGGNSGIFMAPDKTSPGIPTNVRIQYVQNQGYELTWVNPSDSDFMGTRIIRKIGSTPTNIDEGIKVWEGSRVRIRLLADVFINGNLLKKGK